MSVDIEWDREREREKEIHIFLHTHTHIIYTTNIIIKIIIIHYWKLLFPASVRIHTHTHAASSYFFSPFFSYFSQYICVCTHVCVVCLFQKTRQQQQQQQEKIHKTRAFVSTYTQDNKKKWIKSIDTCIWIRQTTKLPFDTAIIINHVIIHRSILSIHIIIDILLHFNYYGDYRILVKNILISKILYSKFLCVGVSVCVVFVYQNSTIFMMDMIKNEKLLMIRCWTRFWLYYRCVTD